MSYERRSGYGGGFRSCPVEMGKEYEVDITETSRQGEGIALSLIHISEPTRPY